MRAQSETVGVVVLLGVVVVATTVGVTGLAMITPEDTDRTQTTLVDLDVSLDSVSVVHAGGESLPAAEVVVRIDHGGTTDVYRLDSDGTSIEGAFEPGDEWALEAVPYGSDVTVDAYVIHEPTNTILDRQRAVFGDGGDGGGGDDDGATSTPTPTPTPTPDPDPTLEIADVSGLEDGTEDDAYAATIEVEETAGRTAEDVTVELAIGGPDSHVATRDIGDLTGTTGSVTVSDIGELSVGEYEWTVTVESDTAETVTETGSFVVEEEGETPSLEIDAVRGFEDGDVFTDYRPEIDVAEGDGALAENVTVDLRILADDGEGPVVFERTNASVGDLIAATDTVAFEVGTLESGEYVYEVTVDADNAESASDDDSFEVAGPELSIEDDRGLDDGDTDDRYTPEIDVGAEEVRAENASVRLRLTRTDGTTAFDRTVPVGDLDPDEVATAAFDVGRLDRGEYEWTATVDADGAEAVSDAGDFEVEGPELAVDEVRGLDGADSVTPTTASVDVVEDEGILAENVSVRLVLVDSDGTVVYDGTNASVGDLSDESGTASFDVGTLQSGEYAYEITVDADRAAPITTTDDFEVEAIGHFEELTATTDETGNSGKVDAVTFEWRADDVEGVSFVVLDAGGDDIAEAEFEGSDAESGSVTFEEPNDRDLTLRAVVEGPDGGVTCTVEDVGGSETYSLADFSCTRN